MSEAAMEFTKSDALTLGVELELQLLSQRDYDLTRGATDLLSHLKYDRMYGDVKLEITESMIEVSTQARTTVDDIAADLEGLRKILVEPKNSIVKQFTKLFEMDGIKLTFTDGALDYIVGAGRKIDTEYAMSNNFAFGGINTSLVFKRV